MAIQFSNKLSIATMKSVFDMYTWRGVLDRYPSAEMRILSMGNQLKRNKAQRLAPQPIENQLFLEGFY
jgi:hypothetical protein